MTTTMQASHARMLVQRTESPHYARVHAMRDDPPQGAGIRRSLLAALGIEVRALLGLGLGLLA